MARRKLTVDRHEEIKRRLADGRSVREIATALGCSRRLVRQIRDGERLTHETAATPDPLWMAQLEWPVIIHELGLGHPTKFTGDAPDHLRPPCLPDAVATRRGADVPPRG